MEVDCSKKTKENGPNENYGSKYIVRFSNLM